jgi:CheY-like chemotaxis protein
MNETGVILVVEDREDDALLMRRAFDQAAISNPLQIARDGAEAIAYLGGSNKYSDRTQYPLPILILLDLKMPGIDGFQVLSWIRSQPGDLRATPVVALTSSGEPSDIDRAYDLGVNAFFVKETDFQTFVNLVHLLERYLVKTALGPETSAERLRAHIH